MTEEAKCIAGEPVAAFSDMEDPNVNARCVLTEDLPTVLALLRVARGWNQERLSNAAGLRSGTISDYERGKMVPGLKTVARILGAQGYSWTALEKAQRFILSLREESRSSSLSVGKNGASSAALQQEIEEVSGIAGTVVSRIVRLMLNAPPPGESASREGNGNGS